MATINFKHLRYFWMVAKSGSIARASSQLHVTPQSISSQLGELETALGTGLFRRVGRGLEVTDINADVELRRGLLGALGTDVDAEGLPAFLTRQMQEDPGAGTDIKKAARLSARTVGAIRRDPIESAAKSADHGVVPKVAVAVLEEVGYSKDTVDLTDQVIKEFDRVNE